MDDVPFDTAVQEIRTGRREQHGTASWGGFVTLEALANALNVRIDLMSSQGKDYDKTFSPRIGEQPQRELIVVFMNGDHYDSTEPFHSKPGRRRPPEFDKLLAKNGAVYASWTFIPETRKWIRALFAMRDIKADERIAYYIGKVYYDDEKLIQDLPTKAFLMECKGLKSDDSDDDDDDPDSDPDYVPKAQHKESPRGKGSGKKKDSPVQTKVTIDGNPDLLDREKRHLVLAAYANHAPSEAGKEIHRANACFSYCDEKDPPPDGYSLDIAWPLLIAREDIPKGREVRVDYFSEQFLREMQAGGIPEEALNKSEYKKETWSFPTEELNSNGAESQLVNQADAESHRKRRAQSDPPRKRGRPRKNNEATKLIAQLEDLLKILKSSPTSSWSDRLKELESDFKQLYRMTVTRSGDYAENYPISDEQTELLRNKMKVFTDEWTNPGAGIFTDKTIKAKFKLLADVATEILRYWHWIKNCPDLRTDLLTDVPHDDDSDE